MESARHLGFDPLGLVTQAQFLMGIGEDNQFADALEDCRLPQERAKVALQLKHLATPVGMGEVFDVLALGKGIATAPASELSGLRFARAVPHRSRSG
jgi:SAM-dependent MidA family methyltransferase